MPRTDYDVTKLPKWAQNRIANLERDLAYEKGQNLLQVQGDTEVFIADFEGDIPLPPQSRIKFVYGDRPDDRIEVHVVKDGYRADGVEVYGPAPFLIEPTSSNIFRLRRAR